MRKSIATFRAVIFAAILFAMSASSLAASDDAAKGEEIFFKRKGSGVGNCIACHATAGADSPGNLGPPIFGVKERFPNRDDLRARLWDPTQFNPISAMPPFGKHGILNAEEIEHLLDFLYTL